MFPPYLIICPFKIPKWDFLRTWLKCLPWKGNVPKADGVIWKLVSNKRHFWSSLDFDSQLTSNRHDLVLLGFQPNLLLFYFRPKHSLKYNVLWEGRTKGSIPRLSELIYNNKKFATSRNRTKDTGIFSPLLYQLS